MYTFTVDVQNGNSSIDLCYFQAVCVFNPNEIENQLDQELSDDLIWVQSLFRRVLYLLSFQCFHILSHTQFSVWRTQAERYICCCCKKVLRQSQKPNKTKNSVPNWRCFPFTKRTWTSDFTRFDKFKMLVNKSFIEISYVQNLISKNPIEIAIMT